MKYVIDVSIAEKWYSFNREFVKALKFRMDFHAGLHDLLAPDIFPAECAGILVKAERQGAILPGDTSRSLDDLLIVAVHLHSSFPLLRRASDISLATRLSLFARLYVALAEREKCQLVTADQKVIRKMRNKFSFVTDFATLP